MLLPAKAFVKIMKSRNCLPSHGLLCLSAVGGFSFVVATSAAPTLPNINTNNVITVTNAPYNATNNGIADNTIAISNAIVAAAAGGNTNGLLGGTVRIPAPGCF